MEKYDYDLEMSEEVKIILVNVKYINKTNKSRTVDTRPYSIEKTGYLSCQAFWKYHKVLIKFYNKCYGSKNKLN